MKLAVNSSSILYELMSSTDVVRPDLAKMHPTIAGFRDDFDLASRSNLGVLLHGFPASTPIGSEDFLISQDIGVYADFASRVRTPLISTHLVSDAKTLECATRKKIMSILEANFIHVVSHLHCPLALENVAWHPRRSYPQWMVDPKFIGEMAVCLGAPLSVDVAHARVSAEYLSMEIWDYLRALPLERVIEVHVSGVRRCPVHGLSDAHARLSSLDIRILRRLIGCCSALKVVALEYGDDMKSDLIHGNGDRVPRNDLRELREQIEEMVLALEG